MKTLSFSRGFFAAVVFGVLACGVASRAAAQVEDDAITVPLFFRGVFWGGPYNGGDSGIIVSWDGGASASGSSSNPGYWNTTRAQANLRPGKDYIVTVTQWGNAGPNDSKWYVDFDPPQGVTVYVNDLPARQ